MFNKDWEIIPADPAEVEPQPEVIHGMPVPDVLTPADRYLELFETVQLERVFADSKTFADCAPLKDPQLILDEYRRLRHLPEFDLKQFVADNFEYTPVEESDYVSDPRKTLAQHIDELWPILTKEPRSQSPFSSLLPLPKSYVVPGGRFSETYYWDSYFSMLGLAESGREDLLRNMADNFAWLIDNYGHIPNGNRTYYLSRSQPPVFALMVELFEEDGIRGSKRYLSQLIKEHDYWMDGASTLEPQQAYRHVVRLPDGSLLNRYWDDRDTPRDESYAEDVETARMSSRPASEVYRDLRAGAASGWDYSSRWLRDPDRLASIRTTQFLPIDLNALLYKLECMIATISASAGDETTSARFNQFAIRRRRAIDRYMWDYHANIYRDYDWRRQRLAAYTAAVVVPLYVGLASPVQGTFVARALEKDLLSAGGLVTSLHHSGQQWDSPNAWAPLQWMAIQGLNAYGEEAMGAELARRWLTTVHDFYRQHAKLVEKYDIVGSEVKAGGGGEYPLQDGFGWTNGVTRRLIALYPGVVD
ncbi:MULTISPECIES: alpha,alpha-trehalase TreF [unclassified Erwinia]|uniref:alpha,alpha-trehalase TreF n=1 Tax=unclassified Erwinia TaxID=2622719 RepID=UPI000C6C02AC|nr:MULTISPECIES: alpha,alpha-trehalase TreF [unclassified Erwinia]PIJ50317.1 alpha,alpha-trehalase [Erwinia sp. OAMSP11]